MACYITIVAALTVAGSYAVTQIGLRQDKVFIRSFIWHAQRLLHNIERTQQSAEWVILTQINSIIHRRVLCFQALLGGAHPHSTGACCGLQFSKVDGNTSIVQKNRLATEMLSDEYSFL